MERVKMKHEDVKKVIHMMHNVKEGENMEGWKKHYTEDSDNE